MDKLKDFLSGKPIWIKIAILICIGVLVYFSSPCSLKADKFYVTHWKTSILNYHKKKSIQTIYKQIQKMVK